MTKDNLGLRLAVRVVMVRAEAMAAVRRLAVRLSDERGAAETSTILAWIVVGVLVVFAMRAGLTEAGTTVISWVKAQLNQPGVTVTTVKN